MKTLHIASLIDHGQMLEAFAQTRALITPADASYTHRLDELQEAYRHSLVYYVEGVHDPERTRIEQWIRTTLLGIALEIEDRHLLQTSPAYYYTRSLSPLDLDAVLRRATSATSPNIQTDDMLLEAVWTTRGLTTAQMEKMLEVSDVYLQSLIITGITLALDYYPSEAHLRYLLLVLARYGGDYELRARAIVGLVLASSYSWLPIYAPAIAPLLDQLLDTDPTLATDFVEATMQMYRSRGTEQTNQQIRDRLQGTIDRLSPEVRERLKRIEADPSALAREDSDWLNALEELGGQDDLADIGEMIQQGHDIFYGMLSMLKGHAHFRHLSAWFAPLSPSNELVHRLIARSPILGERLQMALPAVCDSDCYSMLLVAESLPAGIDLVDLLRGQGIEMPDEVPPPSVGARIKSYVQGLYRFCRLYARRGEHTDYFAALSAQPSTPLVGRLYASEAVLHQLALLAMAQGQYDEGARYYQHLIGLAPAESRHYEGLARVYIKQGRWSEALDRLAAVELIAGETPQLMRQMAHCYYHMADYEATIRLLRRVLASEAGDQYAPLLLRIATAHIALGQWQRALETGYEYELTYQENTRSRRIIALSLLCLGRVEEARPYYDVLLAESQPSLSDFLNAGHTALVGGDRAKALELYRRAYALVEAEAFATQWQVEAELLAPLGVEPELIRAIPPYLALGR